MNSNGVLSFGQPFTECCNRNFPYHPPIIAPFWHDINPEAGGRIFYNILSSASELSNIFSRLSPNFYPNFIFVATWDRVASLCRDPTYRNTFQVVLTADNSQSYILFLYGDLQWGEDAQIGFSVGGGQFPFSLTEDATNVEHLSNVGIPGVFVISLDGSKSSI